MPIAALNNLKQAVLSRVELHGIKAAKARFLDPLPALSRERPQMLREFAQLGQDQAGKWSFKAT